MKLNKQFFRKIIKKNKEMKIIFQQKVPLDYRKVQRKTGKRI